MPAHPLVHDWGDDHDRNLQISNFTQRAMLPLFGPGDRLGRVPMCSFAALNATSPLDAGVTVMMGLVVLAGVGDAVDGLKGHTLEEGWHVLRRTRRAVDGSLRVVAGSLCALLLWARQTKDKAGLMVVLLGAASMVWLVLFECSNLR